MFHKKGLSPLIATVLLIAFAVALGAMIMNWSSGIEPVPVTPGTPRDPCDGVEIELSRAFGQPMFCYQDNHIRFTIENTGSKELAGIKIVTVDQQMKLLERDLTNRIAVGGTFDHEFMYVKSGKLQVELVPMIRTEGSHQYCVRKKIVQQVLPDCSN